MGYQYVLDFFCQLEKHFLRMLMSVEYRQEPSRYQYLDLKDLHL